MKADRDRRLRRPGDAPGCPCAYAWRRSVLVRVTFSSVNGFDVAVANGYLKGVMEHRFPVVLGKDVAGSVEATGSGVGSLEVGDSVFGVVMTAVLGEGAFGELATVAERGTRHVSRGVWTWPPRECWVWRGPPPTA